jgi:hypothetical protein
LRLQVSSLTCGAILSATAGALPRLTGGSQPLPSGGRARTCRQRLGAPGVASPESGRVSLARHQKDGRLKNGCAFAGPHDAASVGP